MPFSELTKRRSRCLAVSLVLLCGPGIAAAQPLSRPAADPVAGAQLFQTRGCNDCHAGDLARFREQPRSLPALAAAMWNHFPAMAERIRAAKMKTPYLTSSELRNLVAFLSPGDPVVAAPDDPRLLGEVGDPARGKQVVVDKGCLRCHSVSSPAGQRAGKPGRPGRASGSPWTVVGAEMAAKPPSFLMELERQGQGGAWAPLSAGEMADLVAYVQALMRAR